MPIETYFSKTFSKIQNEEDVVRSHEGGCLCGAVRYVLKGEPQATVICHCTHCQKQSGSAFSVNLIMPESNLELRGETAFFIDRGDSGLRSFRHFCPKCGSPTFTKAENMPLMAIVKAGTLDSLEAVHPQVEIYADHAVGWFTPVEDTVQFNRAPSNL